MQRLYPGDHAVTMWDGRSVDGIIVQIYDNPAGGTWACLFITERPFPSSAKIDGPIESYEKIPSPRERAEEAHRR